MQHQPQNMEFLQGLHDFGPLCWKQGTRAHIHAGARQEQEQEQGKSNKGTPAPTPSRAAVSYSSKAVSPSWTQPSPRSKQTADLNSVP